MVRKGIFGLLAVGLLGLLVLAGCGGGDSTSALTRGEFIKKGNAICEKARDKRNQAIGEAIAEVPKGQVMSDALKKKTILKILPFYEGMTQELKALGAPEGDQEKVEAIVKAMERAAKESRGHISKAINTSYEYDKANELNQEYGLEECMV